jgi:Tol biopolymer transport system component
VRGGRHLGGLLGLIVALLALIALPATALATFPGANGRIAFVSGGDIWTINPDGSGIAQVTSGPALDVNPAWSPDGTTIAFARSQAGVPSDLWTVHPGSAPVRFTNTPDFWEDYPAWSPDGLRLSFSRACALYGPEEPDCGPYLQMRGTIVVGRTDGPGEYTVALGGKSSWSPDGQQIVFDGGWDAGPLFLANWNGTGVHELPGSDYNSPELVGVEYAPSWSPDGTIVAYSRGRGTSGISLTRTDGTGIAHLIPAEGNDASRPEWSPDGRFIAYASQGDGQVWVMRSDGSDRHAITSGLPAGVTSPSWQRLALPPETGAPVAAPGPQPGVVNKDARCARFPRVIRATTAKMIRARKAAHLATTRRARTAAVKRLRALAVQRAKYRAVSQIVCR